MSETYFDIQVNGYAGVDFNQDELTGEQLNASCRKLEEDGVGGILATIITEQIDVMCHRLAKLAALRERDPLARRMIQGLHVEGPFLNETPGYRGAHPPDAIRPGDMDLMRRLLNAAAGLTRLVTLAPERDDGLKVTRLLSSQGIAVSAGHCDPSLDQLNAALDAGLRTFTHLGNGCPMQMHRHDNIIQRALSLADRLWLCFIADGVHVNFFALRNYLKVAGLERCIVTSDAIAPAGLGPGRYTLGRWDLLIGEDMVARAPDGSHFVGSAMSLKQARTNLVRHLDLSNEQAMLLTAVNPRKALGIE